MDNPSIIATFVTDKDGNPEAIEQGGKKHYRIRVEIQNAPKDTYAVTYRLDDSYYEPIRESRASTLKFIEDLTSYGNFEVKADVRTKQRVAPVSVDLSQALKRGHGLKLTPEIEAALRDIESN